MGNTGAAGELVAAADLIKKGYEVFRALNPTAPCDLIAIKDDQILRIQVKTRHYNRANWTITPKIKEIGNTDLYILVDLMKNNIRYYTIEEMRPELALE